MKRGSVKNEVKKCLKSRSANEPSGPSYICCFVICFNRYGAVDYKFQIPGCRVNFSQIISKIISGFDISIEAVQIKKFRSALNLSTLGGTSFNQSYLNCIFVSTKLDHSFYKKTCVLRRFSSIYNSQ